MSGAASGPFARTLWQAAAPVYDAILDLPFNRELAAGTLDPAVFAFYLSQDALYLSDFARALAVTGARSEAPELVLTYVRFAERALVVERALHATYLAELDVPADTTRSPSCAFYTSHLLATAALRSHEESMAALLPCFWIYREVGTTLVGTSAPGNRYQRWIDTYAGEEFAAGVEHAIAATEQAAAGATDRVRERMTAAFVTSARLEWMFWDSAYRQERWPP